MPYLPKARYDLVYQQLSHLIEKNAKLRCVRADRELQPGRELLAKVHGMILGASIVVADVTEYSPNVYYEYGFASAHDRLPILIARRGVKLPTDLVGKETLRYRKSPIGDAKFKRDLSACLKREMRSPLPEQRRMLASPDPFPAYLIAAPRTPTADSKHWWHPDEGDTFGDMLGISGILTAYGNLFGTRQLPQLLHGQCVLPDVLLRPASFFCIGSSKMNEATKHFLSRLQKGLFPCWKMIPSGRGPDSRIVFQGVPSLDRRLKAKVAKRNDGKSIDYGLIIRAPHPENSQHSRHLVLIVAGRHSIGTHAACMMVTTQGLIVELEQQLKRKAGISLRNLNQRFWCVVKGTLLSNGLMSPDVKIEGLGGYAPR